MKFRIITLYLGLAIAITAAIACEPAQTTTVASAESGHYREVRYEALGGAYGLHTVQNTTSSECFLLVEHGLPPYGITMTKVNAEDCK